MRQSKEARRLYRKLKGDADRLRDLPRRALKPEFAEKILLAIGAQVSASPAPARSVSQRTLPMWATVAAAAAVLLAVSTGTYLIATNGIGFSLPAVILSAV